MKAWIAAGLVVACGCVPAFADRYKLDDANKLVRLSDPEISPDGKRVLVVAGHANLDEDRTESELLVVDVASHQTRVLTAKAHVGFARWSPDGKTIAFLAADEKKNLQIWTLGIDAGGDSAAVTHSPTSIEQIAWRPDGKALAFVAEDDEPERKGRAKYDDAVEVGNNDFLAHSRQMPAHLWMIELPAADAAVNAKKPEAKRLTEGSWSLPISLPPGPPASPVQWSADGRTIYFVKVPTPLSGDALMSEVEVMDVATKTYKPLTGLGRLEAIARCFRRMGRRWRTRQIAMGRAGRNRRVMLTGAGPGAGAGKDLTRALDHNVVRALWMPDGKNLLVAGNDKDDECALAAACERWCGGAVGHGWGEPERAVLAGWVGKARGERLRLPGGRRTIRVRFS